MVADGSGSQSGLLDGRLVFISFVLLFAHMSLWYVLRLFFYDHQMCAFCSRVFSSVFG